MVRNRFGFLAALGALAGAAACSSGNGGPIIIPPATGGGTAAGGGGNTTSTGATAGASGSTGTGGSSGGAAVASCTGDCCPTDPSCYSTSMGNGSPGSECLAPQDNTGKQHVQMRQTYINVTSPAGNAAPAIVYSILAGRSELNWSTCNQGLNASSEGVGGYIELVDLFTQDATNRTFTDGDYAWDGFATYNGTAVTAAPPLCYTQGTYTGIPVTGSKAPDVRLGPSDMSLTAASQDGSTPAWPVGLTPPMPLKDASGNSTPWTVAPARNKRVKMDFDITTTAGRAGVLAMFDKTNTAAYVGNDASGQPYTGIFYYNEATGYNHGFSPLSWVIVYGGTGAAGKTTVLPIREIEKKSTVNDVAHPDCIGNYTGTMDSMCDNGSDPTKNAAWGGGNCTNDLGSATCAPGTTASSTLGYFLITEIEQVWASDLGSTVCISTPGSQPANFTSPADNTAAGGHTCIGSGWHPQADNDTGLPAGDWCAATNSKATASCHDAYHNVSYNVFQGYPIKLDPSGTPSQCMATF